MYYAWTLYVALFGYVFAYLTKYANSKETWMPVLLMAVLNAFNLWPILARFTTNVVFDALLYDVILVVAFYHGIVLFKMQPSFHLIQWVGVIIAVFGLSIIKLYES